MRKTVLWKKMVAIFGCVSMLMQIPALPAYASESDQMTEPKLRFEMESLTGGMVEEKISGASYAVNGSTALTQGRQGEYALEFNGTDTYIDLGTDFQPTSAYTMMGWIRQAPNPADGQAVFYRGNTGKVANQLGVNIKNAQVYHAMSVGSSNSSFQEGFSEARADVGQWHHIAVAREAAVVSFYIDGAPAGTLAVSADDFAATDYPLYIGINCDKDGNVYAKNAFNGAMDDLRLYDTAISAEEIAAIYDAEAQSSFSIVEEESENGKLTLTFPNMPADVQVNEVALKATVDGAEKAVNVTDFAYDSSTGQAVVTYDPFTNKTEYEVTVKLAVTYAWETLETSVVLPGGTNKAPAAADLKVTNLSVSMLGEDPSVKGMLKAEYTFSDEDGDAEGDTKFQWQIADAQDGPFEDLSGICAETVILLDKYEDKYLRCKVTPADEFGNRGTEYFTPSTSAPVKHTDGNPLTDWFYDAEFGISHHFLSNYFNLPGTYAGDSEKWDRSTTTWDEYVGQFDAEEYAKQVNETGAKYVLLTLGQNSGSYCAPNAVYDKYMREAGLLKEGEQNPKTTSMENDLPMKIAKALEPYGIRLMLYLPSNPPHSACWDESGTPNGYGYFSDYLVTKKVFDYTPGQDGVPSQKARKVLSEMVAWWSEHYGDMVSGWWFDGFYHSGAGSQLDMSLEYNVSSLANAAKAGNPYSIVTFNKGTSASVNHSKITDYTDYTAGEAGGLNPGLSDTRWASGDCQLFHFAPLGSTGTWQNRWGCKGSSRSVDEMYEARTGAMENNFVLCFDLKVNARGELDPTAFDQLRQVNERIDTTPPTAPSALTAVSTDSNQIRLEWQPSEENDGVMKGYNIYRDGEFLAFTENTSYVDTNTRENTEYTYTVKGVNAANLISDSSNEAKVTAGKDTEAPQIYKVTAVSRTSINVIFDEPVTKVTAENAENYTISSSVKVIKAELGADGKTVTLTISDMSPEDMLVITVRNVTDTSESANLCIKDRAGLSLRTHYYKFDDISGDTIRDFSGDEDGTKIGTLESGDGKNAGAVKLDGKKNDGVQITSSAFAGSDSFTISAWCNSLGASGQSQTLFSSVTSGTAGQNGIWFYIHRDSRKPCVEVESTSGGGTLNGSKAIEFNQWNHVALTYENGTMILYLNGEEIGSKEGIAGFDAGKWKKNLCMGVNTSGSSYLHGFNGLLDEYKIYAAALTPEEIKAQAGMTEYKPVIYDEDHAFDKANARNEVIIHMDPNGYGVSKVSCGTELDAGSYTIAQDGTGITLKPEYLGTLDNRTHTFQVTFTSGTDTETVNFRVNVTDRTDLKKLYEENKDRAEEEYLEETWKPFSDALAESVRTLFDDGFSQPQIDKMVKTLSDAVDGLRKVPVAVEKYKVTVEGGSGSGEYKKGETVRITAAIPEGMKFIKWTSADVTLDNAGAQSTSFRMPGKNVSVSAEFEKIKEEPQPTEKPVTVDKSGLQNIYDKCVNLTQDKYTDASWKTFAEARDHALNVLKDDKTAQQQVNEAKEKLENAVRGLQEKKQDSDDHSDQSQQSDQSGQQTADSPETGDGAPIAWLWFMLAAGGAAIILLFRRRYGDSSARKN
ncbi:LamG-like jellyroll fold domain-containing protein [Diplocloster hominis]|uniref:LamG-like jellyroll fold domain-containing protein n=1 Tax=Diplocloster hominis TaxID=3079010 RepID=UPI0031BB11EA